MIGRIIRRIFGHEDAVYPSCRTCWGRGIYHMHYEDAIGRTFASKWCGCTGRKGIYKMVESGFIAIEIDDESRPFPGKAYLPRPGAVKEPIILTLDSSHYTKWVKMVDPRNFIERTLWGNRISWVAETTAQHSHLMPEILADAKRQIRMKKLNELGI